MTQGNTHVVYVTRDNLVFRGRNGAPDFVYQDHRQPITALGHMSGEDYAFGDEQGVITLFKFTAAGEFSLTKQPRQMINGPITGIEFIHTAKELQTKIIAIGDGGVNGIHANCQKMAGIPCGNINGSAKALFCCARTAAPDSSTKTKLFSAGETGEIFMHEGP